MYLGAVKSFYFMLAAVCQPPVRTADGGMALCFLIGIKDSLGQELAAPRTAGVCQIRGELQSPEAARFIQRWFMFEVCLVDLLFSCSSRAACQIHLAHFPEMNHTIISSNEQVRWQGKVRNSPYILSCRCFWDEWSDAIEPVTRAESCD